MGKLAFYVSPQNGHLWCYDHTSWKCLITETPPGWNSNSYGCLVAFKDKIYLRYQGNGFASMIEVDNLEKYGPLASSVKPVADYESWSNPVSYQGKIVWLGWPSDSNTVSLYQFDGAISKESFCPDAKSAAPNACSPAIGGTLFVYDAGLFYAPRGLYDPASCHSHLMKYDDGIWTSLDTKLNPTFNYDLSNPWPADSAGRSLPRMGDFHGFCRGAVTAGVHNGELYVLNADGTVDQLVKKSFVRTKCLDLRNAPGMMAGTSLYVMGSSYKNALRVADKNLLVKDQSGILPLLGGRIDVTQGPDTSRSGTIRAMWVDGNGQLELGVQGSTGNDNFTPLIAGGKADIRYGLAGSLSGMSTPCSAQIISSGDALHIITGVAGNGAHAPFMVTTWKGQEPTFFYIVDNGDQANVLDFDAFIDHESQLLHVLWRDVEAIKHVIVNLKLWVQSGVRTIESSIDPITPGILFNYTPGEPQITIGVPRYNPVTHLTEIPYTLWTSSKEQLDSVSVFVEYDSGKGWQPANRAQDHPMNDPVNKLVAAAGGRDYQFVHDVSKDLPEYVGPVQYRMRASIK